MTNQIHAKLALTVRYCEQAIRNADATLQEFAERFANDPTYALEWGDSVYAAAATKKICASILEIATTETKHTGEPFEAEARWEYIRLSVTRDALRGARSPRNSTSPSANLMDRAMTAAYAEFIERVEAGGLF